jgi:hypothetical protein
MLFKEFIKKIYENKNETITLIFPMIGIYEFNKIILYSDDIENIKKHCEKDIIPFNEKTINFNKEKLTIERYEKILCCLNKFNIININLDLIYILKCLVNNNEDIGNVTFQIKNDNTYKINSNIYKVYDYSDYDYFISDNFEKIINLDKCIDKNKLINENINNFVKMLIELKSNDIAYPNKFIEFIIKNNLEKIKTDKVDSVYEKIIKIYKHYIPKIEKILKKYSIIDLMKTMMISKENVIKYINHKCIENNLNKLNAEIKQEKLCGEKYKKIIIVKM